MIRKQLLFCFLLVLNVCPANAQKGNNAITVVAEGSVPVYQNDHGVGGLIKGLYGTGASAQLTFTAGLSVFHSKNSIETQKVITRLVPFMAGYRQNLHKFYIEPQAGFGELGGKIYTNGDYSRPSIGALYWALGVGYNYKRIDIGLRFESAHGLEGSSAGLWHDENFHYTGIHIGYEIFRNN